MNIGLGIERKRGQSGIVYAGTRCIHHDAVTYAYGVQYPLRRRYALSGVQTTTDIADGLRTIQRYSGELGLEFLTLVPVNCNSLFTKISTANVRQRMPCEPPSVNCVSLARVDTIRRYDC